MMLRDAANAENAANQAVAEAEAAARQRAETAQKRAETMVLQKKNAMRGELAKLEAEAKQVENEAGIAAETERAMAEQELQALRAEVEKLRLQCDVVLPAEADRKAQELMARGAAAPTIENGKAVAEALRLVAAEWAAGGDAARDVYALQQLRTLMTAAIARVGETEIGELQVVDGTGAGELAALLASYPAAVARVLDETGRAIGLDVGKLVAARKEVSR
jgi:flotillin